MIEPTRALLNSVSRTSLSICHEGNIQTVVGAYLVSDGITAILLVSAVHIVGGAERASLQAIVWYSGGWMDRSTARDVMGLDDV